MKDMKISDYEKKENSILSVVDDKPSYPYGLKITLDPDVLSKLELGEVPKVGDKFEIIGVAEVTNVNKEEAPGDAEKYSVSLQIQDFDMRGEKREAKISSMMYGED